MIIKEIFLNDPLFSPIKFSNSLNLIYGSTNSGKSFIFKLIEAVFGAEKSIDINAVAKNYPNATEIVCTLESNNQVYTIHRALRTEKVNIFLGDKEEISFSNLGDYGDFIFSLFNFNKDIELINSNSSLASSRLTLREYTKFMFFSESRMTDEKSFVDIMGPNSKLKYQNLFFYLISGISPNQDKLEFKTIKDELKKSKNQVIKYLKAYRENQFGNREKLQEGIKEEENRSLGLRKQYQKLVSEQNTINDNLNVYSSELFKMQSMYDLYQSKNETSCLAKEFAEYLENYHILCDNCGSELKLPRGFTDEIIIFDYEQLRNLIIEKNAVIDELRKKEETIVSEINTIQEEMNNCQKTIDILQKQLNRIDYVDELAGEINKDLSKTTVAIDNARDIKIISDMVIDICKEIKEKIVSSGLTKLPSISDNPAVEFNYAYQIFDFMIDGESRAIKGKGLRTLITVILLLKICEISQKNVGFIGFALIDSLWTSLCFSNSEDQEKAINCILEYMNKLGIQVIMIDNNMPMNVPDDIKINYIKKE